MLQRISLVLFFIVLFLAGIQAQQKSNTVWPKDGYVTDDTTLTLQWDEHPDATSYRLAVATDSLFQNVVLDTGNLIKNSYSLMLQSWQDYHWFVEYAFPNGALMSDTVSFTVFSPKDIDSLVLWLSADTGVVKDSNGLVSQWNDLSGSANAIQNDTASQPFFIDSALNKNPAISFEGKDAFLTGNFNATLPDNKNRSVLLFFKSSYAGGSNIVYSNYIPGISSIYIYGVSILSSRLSLWLGDKSSFHLRYFYTTFDLFNSTTINIDNSHAEVYKNLNYITDNISTKVADSITNYVIGGVTSYGNSIIRPFSGLITEIIDYAKPLDSIELDKVNKYLMHKALPPFNIGPNIVNRYSFCDYTLSTNNMYESYFWNTGDTTRSISVNVSETGWYWCEVTDIFGNTLRDSLYIFPDRVANLNLQDTIICLNTPSDINLPFNQEYSFTWSDGSTDSVLQVNQPGEYSVQVTDSFGCSVYDTVVVEVDSFANEMSLGPDKDICSGGRLGLKSGNSKAQSYLWPDGTLDSLMVVDTAGTYYVEVTDTNGCLARDTINLSIQGITPVVGFTLDSVCYGQQTIFNDTSYTLDASSIIAKTWEFGDDSLSHAVSSSLSHKYPAPGEYTVKLTATTDSGCTNFTYGKAWVHPLPKAGFQPLNSCNRHELEFENLSKKTFGDLKQWKWNFNDPYTAQDSSSQQEPVYIYSRPGSYDVRQIVIDEYGCRDTLEQSIEVRPSPYADFDYSTSCDDNPVFFTSAAVDSANYITEHQWQFTTSDNSTLKNPSFMFDSVGSYPVQYRVQSLNGCWDTITKLVEVHPYPQADFSIPTACYGDTTVFADQSSVSSGQIAQWQWDFGNGKKSLDSTGKTVYADTVQHQVSLQVTTAAGCRDSVIKTVKVHPAPVAGFSADMLFGLPPLEVNFTNTTTGASSWLWNFGDNSSSSQPSPVHVYQDTGIYHTVMKAFNQYGCVDSSSATVYAVYEPIDLILTAGFINIQDGYVNYQCRVYNNSNRPLQNILLEAGINNEYTLRERWTGYLEKDKVLNYTFTAQTPVDNVEDVNLFCFRAQPDVGQKDEVIANNEYCQEYTEGLWVGEPYPNPAGENLSLDIILPYQQNAECQVYDANGNQLQTFTKDLKKGLNKLEFSTKALPQGMYFLHLRFEEEQRVVKFVK